MGRTKTEGRNARAAHLAVASGFDVFPCDPSTKRPLVKWKIAATTDPDQIGRWWCNWPDAMPELPTGGRNGVIDLDMGDGKDGLAAARDVGIDPDAADLIVETAGGGLHLYYEHRPGIANSASKAGLDVRGEGGYVIAPGAVNAAGRSYAPKVGSLATAGLLGLSPFRSALVRPEAPVEQQEPPGGHEIGDLLEALAYVPNDGAHDDWARILMALHHATGGSQDGLALALGWSAGYDGFSVKEVQSKWRSFGRKDGLRVTANTLFAQARRHGWQGVTAADFDDEAETDRTGERLTFLSPAECAATDPRPYVVKGLLAERDVGCIVGAPGVGKSLLAPLLAYLVAQGRDVFGRRTRAGATFYVAAEDQDGMRGRVMALRNEHGDAESFTLVAGVSDLLREDVAGKGSRDYRALRKAVKERRPSLVVIDTLAMAFPGLEENSAEGMGRVVAVARSLTKWGAAVLLVHHDTKDGGQGLPRGHSLLNGALDASVHLRKGDDEIVKGRLTKNRNGPCDRPLAFTIRSEEIGEDEDGDAVTAAIADPLARIPPPPLTEKAEVALMTLENLQGAAVAAISEGEWRAATITEPDLCESEKPDSRRAAFRRARDELLGQKLVRRTVDGFLSGGIGPEDFDDDDNDDL